MRAALKILTLFLSAHDALGKAHVRLAGVRPADNLENTAPKRFVRGSPANPLQQAATAAAGEAAGLAIEPASYDGRELQAIHYVWATVVIEGIPCVGDIEIKATIVIHSDTLDTDIDVVVPVSPDPSTPGLGEGEVEILLPEDELNDEHTELSPDVDVDVEVGECIAGDCEHYVEDDPTEPDPSVVEVVPEAQTAPVVSAPDALFGDPHMVGLRGQKIDWSGVDGGWYSLIKDTNAEINVNVRLTAPLPDKFPDRQLITGISIVSEGRSLVVEVKDPYTVDTQGCPEGVSPCLANGGLRAFVDGTEDDGLLRSSRTVPVADGVIAVSASNLPAECRQFGGDRIWARLFSEMMEGRRALAAEDSLEEWILRSDKMAAPEWCAKYIAENDIAGLQSTHAIFKIETPTLTVRLNAGVNYQGGGEMDGQGRVLPDLEFWQMDIGLDGLVVDSPDLSGILGETARPVYDDAGIAVMEGFQAFRGDVEDYRVSGSLGTDFALFDRKNGARD